jgi:hypothetical protein
MKNESRAAVAPPARARPETGGTATPWAEVFESARSALDGYFLRLARGGRALAEDLFREALPRGMVSLGRWQVPVRPKGSEGPPADSFPDLGEHRIARNRRRENRLARSIESADRFEPEEKVFPRSALACLPRRGGRS